MKEKPFSPDKLKKEYFKDASSIQYDFRTLYIRACEELTLQQEKRDKTISIYVAVIAFLVPVLFTRAIYRLDAGNCRLHRIVLFAVDHPVSRVQRSILDHVSGYFPIAEYLPGAH